MKKNWGSGGSKEDVECCYCGEVVRKDNLERHTRNKHQGKKSSWRPRLIPGQQRIFGFAQSRVIPGTSFRISTEKALEVRDPDCFHKERADDQSQAEKDTGQDHCLNENAIFQNDDLQSTDLEHCSSQEEPQIEHSKDADMSEPREQETAACTSTRKRSRLQEEDGQQRATEDKEDESIDYVASLNKMKDEITKTLTEFLGNISLSATNSEASGNKNTIVDLQLQQLKQEILKCRDPDSLKDLLAENGFDFNPENNQLTCQICTKGVPRVNVADNNAGIFNFNLLDFCVQAAMSFPKQSRPHVNLKHNIIAHVEKSSTHKRLKEKSLADKKAAAEREARNYTIGMNIFRIRYNAIKQGKGYLEFEDDLLTAHLNHVDLGDINHSRMFAAELTDQIGKVIEEVLKENISSILPNTEKARPVGIVADKITPNKRTGHILGLILPVPENPISEPFLVPIMLNLPPVKEHNAIALADQILQGVRAMGVSDDQIEGLGVDGQYVKLGVKKQLVQKLEVSGVSSVQLQGWITEIWEPAHNINLADHYVRDMSMFDWLVHATNEVGDITEVLGIGKGLEQCLDAASELDENLYRLKSYSKTRFAAHAEKSFSNFEKSFLIIVRALEERSESNTKKVRETAQGHLKAILSAEFIATHLGLIDVYRELAQASCNIQKVEQFPWQVVNRLKQIIAKLRDMASCSISDGDTTSLNFRAHWPTLSSHIQEIRNGSFRGLAISSAPGLGRRRSMDDEGQRTILMTVQNRITSLCRYQATRIEDRTVKNAEHPYPSLIEILPQCFDLQLLYNASMQEGFNECTYGVEPLQQVAEMAGYSESDQEMIMAQYNIFKARFLRILSEGSRSVTDYEHLLFETHRCTKVCNVTIARKCPNHQKLLLPKKVITMKFLHWFLKDEESSEGIKQFLHLFLRCSVKTHAESIAESMGSYVDYHSDKRCGLDIEDVGREAFIHWNGPPVDKAGRIGEAALDGRFGGRSNRRFVTRANKTESVVISRLRREKPRLPFF